TNANFNCSVTAVLGGNTIQVKATDRAGNTATATRTIRLNAVPTANAGSPQTVVVGSTVTLNGSGSDPDGDTLSYRWTLVSKPAGSGATLSNPSISAPTFVADRVGTYALTLVVNDGLVDSAVASLQIVATPPPNRTPTASAGGPYTIVAK